MRTLLLIAFALTSIYAVAVPAKKAKKFACPKLETIDCMPMVKPEFASYCKQPMRKKIEKACPSIQFLD